ncbi:MAG: MarR family transcriptional regulator [Proteobacteria bacterium]|nr:MarR family transcriptional regulator [Pseudomonadota bacterium]
MSKSGPAPDRIDTVQAQWRKAAPELDTSPIGVLGRINRIAALASGPITAAFKAHGLDRGEFDVLGTLVRSGGDDGLTPTDLYTELMISSGGLTHRLNQLEKAGLIVREKSAEDGRSWRVRPTPKGRKLAVEAYGADLAAEARLLEGLGATDRAKLETLLRDLHRLVEVNAGAMGD